MHVQTADVTMKQVSGAVCLASDTTNITVVCASVERTHYKPSVFAEMGKGHPQHSAIADFGLRLLGGLPLSAEPEAAPDTQEAPVQAGKVTEEHNEGTSAAQQALQSGASGSQPSAADVSRDEGSRGHALTEQQDRALAERFKARQMVELKRSHGVISSMYSQPLHPSTSPASQQSADAAPSHTGTPTMAAPSPVQLPAASALQRPPLPLGLARFSADFPAPQKVEQTVNATSSDGAAAAELRGRGSSTTPPIASLLPTSPSAPRPALSGLASRAAPASAAQEVAAAREITAARDIAAAREVAATVYTDMGGLAPVASPSRASETISSAAFVASPVGTQRHEIATPSGLSRDDIAALAVQLASASAAAAMGPASRSSAPSAGLDAAPAFPETSIVSGADPASTTEHLSSTFS